MDARDRAEAAWRQILEEDDDERTEAFARAMLRDCRLALERIVDRLRADGFPKLLGMRRCAPPDIRALEDLVPDSIPRILVLFWEEVGGVVLADNNGRIPHVQFLRDHGFMSGGHTDALWLYAPDPDYLTHVSNELEACEEAGDDLILPLAPDCETKDGYSGSGLCGIELGDDDWQPELYFGEQPRWVGSNGIDFVPWLRTVILTGGGFPGLIGDPDFEPLRRKLVADLPIF